MLRLRNSWRVVILLLVALALVACGGASEEIIGEEPGVDDSSGSTTDTSAPAASGEVIRIGGLAPLSAPGSVVGGEAMREAMIIAVEELNASGGILGRPVELIIVDTEGLPERGTAVMEKLINQDNVVGIGGGYHSSVGVAAKEVAHDNGVPVVFAETWNDTITSSGLPEVFRIAPLNSEVSAVDVRFITSLPGISKVVIVTENTDYGIPAAESTTAGLLGAGIEAVTFGVDIGTQDFAGIVERVKAENPDFIMVLATGEAAYNFQQQAADAGIGPQDVPMLCNQVSLESNAFWTNVPDGNFCFMRRVGLPTELYNDVAKSFVDRYTARTGKSAAESYALEAYDSIMILAQAIEEAGTTDPQAIIAALEAITYEGALGTITFPYGSNNTPAQAGVEDKFWHQFPDPAITIVQYQAEGQDSTVAPVVFPATYQTGDIILVSGAVIEQPDRVPSGEPIRIGGLAPLSAPGAVVGGEAMRDAMIIAVEELNASGGILGRPVELIIVDTEGLPERGTAVMEKLINQDNVVGIGGGYHSSVGVAAKEVAHDNGVPVVFAETWNDTITSSGLPEVFRIAPLNSEVSAVDVRFITSLPGISKVVIVTENTDYGIPAAESTTAGLLAAGIEAVTFGVDIGTQDFAGIVERVKAENPDFIMVLATGEAAYNFQQQAADAGIGPQDVPMLCNQVSLESNAFWTNVPDGNFCFMRRVGLPTELYNDVARSFVDRYTARTGKSAAESYALEAYDSIMILAQAIEEAGTTDPQAIIAALEAITYEGALGTITFPYGSNNTPAQAGVEDKFWHQFPDPAITIVQYQAEGQDSTVAPVVFPDTYRTGDMVLVSE